MLDLRGGAMNRWWATFCGLVLCLVLCCCSWAQTSISLSGSPGSKGFGFKATFSGPPPYTATAVSGAPYSGERVTETRQTLADGTNITRNTTSQFMSRDSQGRTRTERIMGGVESRLGIKLIDIDDPVAGYRYVLDTYNHVVHRLKLPPPPVRTPIPTAPSGAAGGRVTPAPPGPAAGPAGTLGGTRGSLIVAPLPPSPSGGPGVARPTITNERLGSQIMEGVTVEGTRTTMTYTEGMVGNDRPFSVISENWLCRDLRTIILSKTTDPRNGENTTRLTNLSIAEPDASLFQPPPDYPIVDEEGPFTIEVKAP
jgi:hypothetical protein